MAFMFMLSRNRRNRVFADDRPRTTARSCANASHNGVKLWVCSPRSDQRRRSIVGPPTALTSFLASLDGKLTEPSDSVQDGTDRTLTFCPTIRHAQIKRRTYRGYVNTFLFATRTPCRTQRAVAIGARLACR